MPPEPSAGEDLLEVGRITRPHGVRGEVKVQLHWQESEALFLVDRVHLSRGAQLCTWVNVAGARRASRFVLLALQGYDTMDRAEELRGAIVQVSRSALPPLERGEYYLADLVGARVEHDGVTIGVVKEVRPYATVDALVIEAPSGERWEQPVVDHWIERVDVDGGRVVLSSREGLIG